MNEYHFILFYFFFKKKSLTIITCIWLSCRDCW